MVTYHTVRCLARHELSRDAVVGNPNVGTVRPIFRAIRVDRSPLRLHKSASSPNPRRIGRYWYPIGTVAVGVNKYLIVLMRSRRPIPVGDLLEGAIVGLPDFDSHPPLHFCTRYDQCASWHRVSSFTVCCASKVQLFCLSSNY